MKMLSVLLPLVLLSALLLAFKCPEDGSGGFFTGNTRTNQAGKQMKEYKCYMYGHLVWVPAD